jgi:hypothetical protein
MKNNITSPTKNRRKVVIPFAGEENFVVPKKGGFGQPDNDKYVMVAGSTSRTPIVTDLTTAPPPPPPPASEGTTAPAPAPATTTTAPRTTTLPVEVLLQSTTLPTQQNTTLSTSTSAPRTTPVKNTIPTEDISTPITIAETPIVSISPTFPNWASLDCTTLKAKIDELNMTMATSRFGASVVDLYNSQLAIAKNLLQTNCPNENPNTDVTAGGFHGGGGGGGSAPEEGVPTEEQPATVENKSNIGTWLLLGGVALGLYLLSKKA